MGLLDHARAGRRGPGRICAIVHNAATFRRHVELQVSLEPELLQRLKKPRLDIVGGKPQRLGTTRTKVVLQGMDPGENRWVGLTFTPPPWPRRRNRQREHQRGRQRGIINGFGVGARLASTPLCILRTLDYTAPSSRGSRRCAATNSQTKRSSMCASSWSVAHPAQLYVQLLEDGMRRVQMFLAELRRGHTLGDPFGTARSRAELVRRISAVRGTAVDNATSRTSTW